MNINSSINGLLESLQPAHKIMLSDDMFLIKFHKNKIFSGWLEDKNAVPKIKSFHSAVVNAYVQQLHEEVYGYGETETRVGHAAEPLFITVAIIKNSEAAKVDISCCKLDIHELFTTSDISNKFKSGIIFNGSYFYLQNHLTLGFYDEHGMEFEYNPIGYFKYNSDVNDDQIGITNISTKKSLSVPFQKPDGTNILTLDLVKDTLGAVIFPRADIRSGKTLRSEMSKPRIVRIDAVHEIEPLDNQIIMGNLLVYNRNLIMTEDKVNFAVLLIEGPSGFPLFTKGNLCDLSGEPYTGEQLITLPYDTLVKLAKPDGLFMEVQFNKTNLNLPYFVGFFSREGTKFAGLIPPGFPTHASDLNPRTCLFIDENDNMFVVQVEGRHVSCGGIGIDLFDLAKLCLAMGAVYAINLDGGGSSKLLWKELNNIPDYAGLKKYIVSNAIMIRPNNIMTAGNLW